MPAFRCVELVPDQQLGHGQDADAGPVVCVGDVIATDAEEGFLRWSSPPPRPRHNPAVAHTVFWPSLFQPRMVKTYVRTRGALTTVAGSGCEQGAWNAACQRQTRVHGLRNSAAHQQARVGGAARGALHRAARRRRRGPGHRHRRPAMEGRHMRPARSRPAAVGR